MTRLRSAALWLRALLSEADNATPSVFRVMALALSVHLAVLASWVVFVLGQALDFTSYGTALAALWAAAGLGERVAGPHKPHDGPPEGEG